MGTLQWIYMIPGTLFFYKSLSRSQFLYLLGHFVNNLREFPALCSGDPGELNAALLDPEEFEETLQGSGLPSPGIVSREIVAVSRMAA